MKSIQCIGVSNEKNNNQYTKDNRCKVMVKQDSARSKLCQNPEKNMCFMHCDCAYCSSEYLPTENKGKIHKDIEENKKQEESKFNGITMKIIKEETDIDKLKCLLEIIAKEIPLTTYLRQAKELYQKRQKNKYLIEKIQSLEVEINKLKEELI